MKATDQQIIDLGLTHIPNISKDYTDRNRTSPFAFTGNKFEFRAVGSSANVAVPMSILNAAVATSFKECATKLRELMTGKSMKRDEAVMELIRDICKKTKNIRFEGNGYSQKWRDEAKKRGLPILNTSAEALSVFNNKKATQFLADTHVLSQEEITSRYHINVERYVKTLDIEFESLIELTKTFVIPSLEKQMIQLSACVDSSSTPALKKLQKSRQQALEKVFASVLENLSHFEKLLEKSHKTTDESVRMHEIVKTLSPQALELREACDLAETLVADEFWSLPKYREMLFANTLA